MELSKTFEHNAAETKWYGHWIEKKYFSSTPDEREPYTVVIPPPNVTGVLHMGHCLNNTIQDVLVRRARMQGKNACWVPGTDHASIATEAKVVQMLREKGIQKASLSRDEFLQYAWEWKEKYGGIILQQLKKLGCSLDWNRTSFTMDPDYYQSVIKVFIDLHKKGIIYRGLRMVNWDPVGKTALSDEEVIFKEVDSKLFYVKYPLTDNSNEFITVATTRPETILGDVAICVNPDDERYKAWIGKEVIVPIINRKIPIIADEYVDAAFGTGALKITPAHDKNDNELGRKHNLKALNTLDAEGRFTSLDLMDESPSELVMSYNGIDRFELRKKIADDISKLNQLDKVEDYKGQVGTSERTGAIIESRLSLQWFINMKEFLNRNPETLAAVMNDEIKFYPEKTKNTYSHWLNNIKDWCISRQLWWGQRIPAWYLPNGEFVVAETATEAVAEFKKQYNYELSTEDIHQDEDCLDTWFSSWLWPMEVFKGISNPGNKDAEYYYPTTTLVTGQDIIFFWVARMIMAGYEYKNERPFKDVYFTGMVRDKQGRKMSKQLGNSPDLLGLIDQYGADAVRFGILISSPAGNDLLWDESSNEQGRNFNNKLWNALKLVKMWEANGIVYADRSKEDFENISFPARWFEYRLHEVKTEINQLFKEFRLSEALKTIYSLIWDDFCSWYLEWVKPPFGSSIDGHLYSKTIEFFEELMQLLHPFMPFITEEIYHRLRERTTGDDVTIRQLQQPLPAETGILQQGVLLKEMISTLRDLRVKQQLKPKDTIRLAVETSNQSTYASIVPVLCRQVNATECVFVTEPVIGAVSTVIQKDKFYILTAKEIDTSSQKEQLLKDLDYYKGFLLSVEKKLSNERFVQNAKPEVVELEQRKKADAEAKIKAITESLEAL